MIRRGKAAAVELKAMNTWRKCIRFGLGVLPLVLAATPGLAQVPVDENGNVVGDWEDQAATESTGNEGIPLLSRDELQDIVGPVALYPDDLLAIVLPAATYPLQIVQAARFLENLKSDPSLEPDPKWDDSIVALLNYPEVIELLNEDLDWTWQLGEAVVAQQGDVVSAVEAFRNTAYTAGNLRSDDHQQVTRDEGVIEISPVRDDVIYVPYYEPEQVVVYQPRQVYYYHARAYPVYYYPYPDHHAFHHGYFWGVTTAFTIGWRSDRLHVYHHSYHGHPYYGHHYWNRWWYRRPSISHHNTVYVNTGTNNSHGDHWRPSRHTRLRHTDQRIARNVVTNSRNVGHHNRNTVQTNIRRTAPVREADENLRRERSQVRERRTNIRTRAPAPRQTVDRPVNTQARNDSRRNSHRESRSEPRSEPRREVRREPRSEPRREVRREPRSEPRREARREPRSEPRREAKNEARNDSRRESRNDSRAESAQSRQTEQRQARNNTKPRRRRH